MEWIKVTDELPKAKDKSFVICLVYSNDITYYSLFNPVTENFLDHQFRALRNVTHWQLLPEPPCGGVVENFAHTLDKEPLTEALNKHNVMESVCDHPLDRILDRGDKPPKCSKCGYVFQQTAT